MSRARTLDQDRAIAWYCREKQLIPQLSAHPMYFFRDKSDGREIEINITTIIGEWRQYLAEIKQSRGRR